MATVFRPPLFTKIPAAGQPTLGSGGPNTLLTTLKSQDTFFSGAGKAPCYDWPNPTRAIEVRQFLVVASCIALLTTPATPTIQPQQWPNPILRIEQILNRTHLDSFKLPLIGKDQFFGSAGMGPDYDYPNPTLRIRPTQDFTQSTNLGLLLRPIVPPVPDNPRGPIQPIVNFTHIDPVKLNLLGRDQFFGSAGMGPDYDYPNPTRSIERRQDFTQSTNEPLFDSSIPVVPPVWQLPVVKYHSIGLYTHTDSFKLTLLGKDQFFASPGMGPDYDYPNPIRTVERRQADSQSTNKLLYDITASLIPTFPPVWQIPTVKPVSVIQYAHADWFKLELLGKDQFFGAPGQGPNYNNQFQTRAVPPTQSWSQSTNLELLGTVATPPIVPEVADNPIVVPFPGIFRTHVQSLRLELLRPTVPTVAVNPRGPIHPIGLRTHTDSFKLGLLGKDQFFGPPGVGPNYDHNQNPKLRKVHTLSWEQSTYPGLVKPVFPIAIENPKGPVHPIYLRTFIDSPKDYQLQRPLVPIPVENPRGARLGITQYTHIDSYKLPLIGKDQFFGASGQVQTHMIAQEFQRTRYEYRPGSYQAALTLYVPATWNFRRTDVGQKGLTNRSSRGVMTTKDKMKQR